MRIFFPGAPIHQPLVEGYEIHIYQVVRQLRRLGHQVVTFEPDENPEADVWPRTPVSLLRALRWADVFYTRPAERPGMPATLAGFPYRLAIPGRCAVVWEQNRALTTSLYKIKRTPKQIRDDITVFRKIARRVDAAIGVAPQVTSELSKLLGIKHTTTIQNGADHERFHPDVVPLEIFKSTSDRLRVAFIGSHANSVHDAALIEATARYAESQKFPIEFHIIGRTQTMFTSPLPMNFCMHGPVTYDDLPRYVAAMDIGLTLYNQPADGVSPLKLFVYMAAGCVPVCSSGSAVEQVLAGTDAGVIGAWDAVSLADQLMTLHQDRERLRQMAQRARGLIEHQYSWQRVAQRIEAFLFDAVDRRRRKTNALRLDQAEV